MATTPLPLPARGPFTPRFILPNELSMYGLPDANRQPAILSLVDAASSLIDTYCGRIDGTGQGSLVYTTYMERLLMQAVNRNIVRLTFKPLVPVSATTVNLLTASANNLPVNPTTSNKIAGAQQLLYTNYFWTGCQASTIPITGVPGSTISPILGCSGRYSYARRGAQQIYPDLNYGANILQIAAFFGGPPTWQTVDLTMSDFDISTGEIWIPAGLYLSQYTELVVQYNSGYDPLNMPRAVKQACALLIRNFLSRGGGTTGLRSISTAGTANVSFTPDLIDSTCASLLDPYKTVMAY
jgi:hypothetical protein